MLVNLGIHTLFTLILAYYYYNTFRLIPHFIQVYYISSLYYISTVQCSLTLFITTYLSQHVVENHWEQLITKHIINRYRLISSSYWTLSFFVIIKAETTMITITATATTTTGSCTKKKFNVWSVLAVVEPLCRNSEMKNK